MKCLRIVAWISGGIAVALMILGAVSLMLGNNLLGVRHEANFYVAASSFLLLGILSVLGRQACNCNKN